MNQINLNRSNVQFGSKNLKQPSKLVQKTIDMVSTQAHLAGRPSTELKEHLLREVLTAPAQKFRNSGIIIGIIKAFKFAKK